MNRILFGFFLALSVGTGPAFASGPGVKMTGKQWLSFDETQRANAVKAAVKVSNPRADWYTGAVHRYDTMRCMDMALSGKAAKYAARKNLFMLLKACAMQTK